ncbi:MAG: phospholipid carrier-dependent glycosyltransferase [bacterium]|nr:phospholipid carrier-dependent glycosyltransferase [bacterium]
MPPSQHPQHRLASIILTVLFILAFSLRVWGMREKGLFLHDEADIMLRVRTYVTLAKVLPHAVALWWQGDVSALRAFSYEAFPSGFFPSFSALPAHIVPGVIIALIFGEHDWTLVLWNAFLGALTVLAAYLLIWRLSRNRVVAVMGAALLALSPYHVLYSRTAHAQISAGFFFTLAVFLYIESFYATERTRYRFLFFAGISLALMVSSHYGTLPILFFFGCLELIVSMVYFRSESAGRWGVLAIGVAMPFLFFQAFLSFRENILVRAGYDLRDVQSYTGEVIEMTRSAVDVSLGAERSWPEPFYFFDLIQYAHGWMFALLFGASSLLVVVAIKRRSLELGVFLWLTWIPLIFYSLLYVQAPRRFVVCLPIAVVAIALLLDHLWAAYISRKHLATAIMLAIGVFMIGSRLPQLKNAITLRSPYPQAATALKKIQDTRSIVAIPWPLYQYYGNMRIDSTALLANPSQPIMLVDDYAGLNISEALAAEKGRVPFLQLPNPVGSNYFLLRDMLSTYSQKDILRMVEYPDPRVTSIRFYDITP